MKNIILFNIISFIDGLCNLLFFILIVVICYGHFTYGINFSDIKGIWYILLILCLIGIIFIPPEEELKKILLLKIK